MSGLSEVHSIRKHSASLPTAPSSTPASVYSPVRRALQSSFSVTPRGVTRTPRVSDHIWQRAWATAALLPASI